jgi:hypothetical protein
LHPSGLLILGGGIAMTHREFLIWLKDQLESTAGAGLTRDGVSAVRDRLKAMRKEVPLQPFASKLFALVRDQATLDAAAVANLAAEVRSELSPARERTIVAAAAPGEPEKAGD